MAYNQFDVTPTSGVVAVTAAIKTVLGVNAATNVVLQITEASVSFDGATSSYAPNISEFDQITYATNAPGTASTAATPAKKDTGRAETFQCVAAYNWTTQPTVITRQWTLEIGNYNGLYHYINPFASPFICIGGKGCGISITASNNCNYLGKISGIE